MRGCDHIGQLTSALGKESGGATNRLLEQLSYVYDAAHNLNYRTNNALAQNFAVNSLNELSNSTRSGTLTVEGTTGAPATNVTVNGSSATLYSDSTFAEAGFTVTNGSNSFTAIAADSLGRHSTNTVNTYLPSTNNYSYDLNGNLLYDGLRAFTYDDENQLISVTVSNAWQSQFVYDGKMRRRITKEFTWSSASTNWFQTNEVRYIYDGNVVVQERDINNLPVTTYSWGRDLSGSLQGAGGIGGMLAMSQPSTINSQHCYYHCDGNGNITAMINAQQIIVAKYLFDAFGNILSMSGQLASVNLYRFSSREFHPNSGLVYYLYRFYDPNLQRWLNRDPLGETGFEIMCGQKPLIMIFQQFSEFREGPSLYMFVNNDPIAGIDPVGLAMVGVFGVPHFHPSQPPPGIGGCISRCLAANHAAAAAASLGISLGTGATLPFKGGVGPFGSGQTGTTAFSLIEYYTGLSLRGLGRVLNPYADMVCVASAGYLAGATASCSALCANDPSSF